MRQWGYWKRLTMVVAFVVGAGCGASQSHRQISLQNSDTGRTVAVAVGDELDVTLQTVGPGQYGTPSLSSASVQFLGVSLAGAPNPGGPTQLFRFEASAPGRAELSIQHEGESPGGPALAPFRLTIEVH